MTHATPRVGHIAGEAGDDVDVEMGNGLACCCASVGADVVAIRGELDVETPLHAIDQRKDRVLLLIGGFPPGLHHTSRDDQRVAGAHGIAVADRECQIVDPDPVARVYVEED